jgi:hypothetical protein
MIQSFLISNKANGTQYLFYDTVLDGKHVFTAFGIGRIEKDNAMLTPVGRETLLAATGYAQNSNKACGLRFQEIATIQGLNHKIRDVLKSANDKDFVFFICGSADIYDAAVSALHVQWVFPGPEQ